MASDMSFFTRAPLGDAKVNVVNNAAKAKRAPSGVLVSVAKKPRAERALLTPQPSSGAPEPSSDGAAPLIKFKIPALPARLAPPTPSTSTVAASSSPRRGAASSSPTRRHGRHYVLRVVRAHHAHTDAQLQPGTTLIFGRHHARATPPSMQLSSIPQAMRGHLSEVENDVRVVVLDRAARHASRVHAAVELADGGKVVRLLVLGQNGVRVRTSPVGKHRRLLPGQVATFSPGDKLEIDFYGASVALRVEDDERERERLFTPEPEDRAASPLSLPPSSPPLAPVEDESSESDEDEAEAEARRQRAGTPRPPAVLFSRSSSPLSEPDNAAFGLLPPIRVPLSAVPAGLLSPALATAGSRPGSAAASPRSQPRSKPATPRGSPSTPSAAQIAVKTELVAATHQPRAGTPKSRPSTPPLELPPFPEGLDLAALLASTVVFSGSSKLSLPDLVKSLLESQPSLREHGSEAVWSAWADKELESNAMFGKVSRNGKDSSGRPLLPHYFYNPANDPDGSRAQQLGGLVRPLRAAQRAGGKAIDWRPVGSGRRRYY
ncbi:hypothetical protein Q8F55_001872 [Vanrija albida]|uniref:FHA domain-containing protein n=1 Tax=Vanrija albida TaxID=181172 RepID=A0ABR3Q871_9TREE